MKKETLFVLGLAALLGYLYFKNKNKATADALKAASNDKTPAPAPTPAPAVTNSNYKDPVTVADLSNQTKLVLHKQDWVPGKRRRPELKQPIRIPASNLIPNVYDRGVNAPIDFQDNYASFSGQCSENIQSACNCAKTKDKRFKLDVPKLP